MRSLDERWTPGAGSRRCGGSAAWEYGAQTDLNEIGGPDQRAGGPTERARHDAIGVTLVLPERLIVRRSGALPSGPSAAHASSLIPGKYNLTRTVSARPSGYPSGAAATACAISVSHRTTVWKVMASADAGTA